MKKKTLKDAAQNRENAMPTQQETANHCSDVSLQVIVSSVRQTAGKLRLWDCMRHFCSFEVALSGFDKSWHFNLRLL